MDVAMNSDAGKCPEEPEKLLLECDGCKFVGSCSGKQSWHS